MISKISSIFFFTFLLNSSCWAAAKQTANEVPEYSPELRQELETLSEKSFIIFDEKNRCFINGWGSGLELINKLAYEGCLAELAHALFVEPLCVDVADSDGKYPLEKALDGVADSVRVQGADCVKCMELLVKCGALPNMSWRGRYFGKPVDIPLIFRAAVIKKFDAVAVLLAAGADVTSFDRYGHSIFFWVDMPNPCRIRSSQEDRIKLEIKKLLANHFISLLSVVAQKSDLNEFIRLFNFFTIESRFSAPALQALLKSPNAYNIINFLRAKRSDLKNKDWLTELIGEQS